jgi:hypothetical protein
MGERTSTVGAAINRWYFIVTFLARHLHPGELPGGDTRGAVGARPHRLPSAADTHRFFRASNTVKSSVIAELPQTRSGTSCPADASSQFKTGCVRCSGSLDHLAPMARRTAEVRGRRTSLDRILDARLAERVEAVQQLGRMGEEEIVLPSEFPGWRSLCQHPALSLWLICSSVAQ